MLATMTQSVRSFKSSGVARATWHALSSPHAANDTALDPVQLGRSLPKDPRELQALLATLDLKEPRDLRAAALLVMVRLGLRKREIVELDVSDVVMVGRVACLAVRSRKRRGRPEASFLPLLGADSRILARYLARQHHELAPLTAPLFYNVEHGREDRLTRITVNAISYWLFELRLRARARSAHRR
jgi:site-specific recombinase XerD